MKNLLFYYIIAMCIYLIGMHVFAFRKKLSTKIVLFSHAIPTLTALTMTYIFIIGRGETVAQFAAGSETAMNMWSLWVNLFPFLIFGTLGYAIIHFIWLIAAGVNKSTRKWLPIIIASLLMSIFAFFVVLINFPSA